MPALNYLRDRMMAVPNTPESNKVSENYGHCSRACTIALATLLPIIALIIILTITYFAWGQNYLKRRRQEKELQLRVRDKMGGEEDESVASSDVRSLNGAVHHLNEEGRTEGRAETGTQTQSRRVEEGHEHDHVLAMITARP